MSLSDSDIENVWLGSIIHKSLITESMDGRNFHGDLEETTLTSSPGEREETGNTSACAGSFYYGTVLG